jgi:hypothetical protein
MQDLVRPDPFGTCSRAASTRDRRGLLRPCRGGRGLPLPNAHYRAEASSAQPEHRRPTEGPLQDVPACSAMTAEPLGTAGPSCREPPGFARRGRTRTCHCAHCALMRTDPYSRTNNETVLRRHRVSPAYHPLPPDPGVTRTCVPSGASADRLPLPVRDSNPPSVGHRVV